MTTIANPPDRMARFPAAYAEHREAEGRRSDPEALATLPYLNRGPFARERAARGSGGYVPG